VEQRLHPQELDRRLFGQVQVQRHSVSFVFLEPFPEAVDQATFDDIVDRVNGLFACRQKECEKFKRRGFFVENQGHFPGRNSPSKIDRDEPIFGGII